VFEIDSDVQSPQRDAGSPFLIRVAEELKHVPKTRGYSDSSDGHEETEAQRS